MAFLFSSHSTHWECFGYMCTHTHTHTHTQAQLERARLLNSSLSSIKIKLFSASSQQPDHTPSADQSEESQGQEEGVDQTTTDGDEGAGDQTNELLRHCEELLETTDK